MKASSRPVGAAIGLGDMRRTLLAALACLCVAASHAQSGLALYLSDVLTRPDYKSAYERMLQDERRLPPWMASIEAARSSTMTPGRLAPFGDEKAEVFDACRPHSCGDEQITIAFTQYGDVAKAILVENGATRFLGHPTNAERQTLTRLFQSR